MTYKNPHHRIRLNKTEAVTLMESARMDAARMEAAE